MAQKKPFPTVAVAVALVFAGVLSLSGRGAIGPAPSPQPVPAPLAGDPDLFADFKAAIDRGDVTRLQAREHAIAFADVTAATARMLRYDWSDRVPAEKRRIKTGVNLAQFRNDVRDFAMEGWTFTAKYPSIKGTVTNHLNEAASRDSGDLTKEAVERWAKAFDALSRSALNAESRL